MAQGETVSDMKEQDPELQPIGDADEWEPVEPEGSASSHLAAIVSVRLDPDAALGSPGGARGGADAGRVCPPRGVASSRSDTHLLSARSLFP